MRSESISSVFHFKQFDVDQSDCGMKINTDGVLCGALSNHPSPSLILDIGTGTGVIALMLAQRFPSAMIDAIEIDPPAASTASKNFMNSPFSSRLRLLEGPFQQYAQPGMMPPAAYDLIVSNPPFFLNSLKNPDRQKHKARHTDHSFFSELTAFASRYLTHTGRLSLILPLPTVEVTVAFAQQNGLYPESELNISSYPNVTPHRKIVTFGFEKKQKTSSLSFIIYEREKEYSQQYREALKPFFKIF